MGEMKDNFKPTTEIENLAFKVKYANKVFEFGFGEVLQEDNGVDIKAEFKLTKEEFKVYFSSILESIEAYNEENGENIIKEIFGESE